MTPISQKILQTMLQLGISEQEATAIVARELAAQQLMAQGIPREQAIAMAANFVGAVGGDAALGALGMGNSHAQAAADEAGMTHGVPNSPVTVGPPPAAPDNPPTDPNTGQPTKSSAPAETPTTPTTAPAAPAAPAPAAPPAAPPAETPAETPAAPPAAPTAPVTAAPAPESQEGSTKGGKGALGEGVLSSEAMGPPQGFSTNPNVGPPDTISGPEALSIGGPTGMAAAAQASSDRGGFSAAPTSAPTSSLGGPLGDVGLGTPHSTATTSPLGGPISETGFNADAVGLAAPVSMGMPSLAAMGFSTGLAPGVPAGMTATALGTGPLGGTLGSVLGGLNPGLEGTLAALDAAVMAHTPTALEGTLAALDAAVAAQAAKSAQAQETGFDENGNPVAVEVGTPVNVNAQQGPKDPSQHELEGAPPGQLASEALEGKGDMGGPPAGPPAAPESPGPLGGLGGLGGLGAALGGALGVTSGVQSATTAGQTAALGDAAPNAPTSDALDGGLAIGSPNSVAAQSGLTADPGTLSGLTTGTLSENMSAMEGNAAQAAGLAALGSAVAAVSGRGDMGGPPADGPLGAPNPGDIGGPPVGMTGMTGDQAVGNPAAAA